VKYDSCRPIAVTAVRSQTRCNHGQVTAVLQLLPETPIVPAYVKLEDGSCQREGNGFQPQEAREVPLTEFVAARSEVLPVGGGLSVQRAVAEDGTEQNLALLRGDHWCVPEDVGGQLRCVDRARARPSLFADASCTAGAAAWDTCAYDDPIAGIVSPKQPALAFTYAYECSFEGPFFALGGEVTTPYSDAVGSCSGWPQSTYDGVLAVSDELSPSDLPALELISKGKGRLKALNLGHDGAMLLGPARWADPFAELVAYTYHMAFYDSELGVECAPRLVEGGDIRCVPSFMEGATDFADSACTEPLITEYDTCEPPQFRGAVSADRCTVTELYGRAEPYEGPLWGGGEGCAELGTTSAGGRPVYRSERIPLEDLARLEQVR